MDDNRREVCKIFAPKSARSLKLDYPELGNYPELKVLRPRALLFVWYYACKSSPYYDLDTSEKDIIEKCIESSGYLFDDKHQESKFLVRNFPEKINAGIKVMIKFEPAARIIAKLDAMQDLMDIKKMTSLELDANGNHEQFEDKDGNVDFNKKKHYMDMVLKANEKRGKLLQTIEQGFGVDDSKNSNIDKNVDENGSSFGESYHDQ